MFYCEHTYAHQKTPKNRTFDGTLKFEDENQEDSRTHLLEINGVSTSLGNDSLKKTRNIMNNAK